MKKYKWLKAAALVSAVALLTGALSGCRSDSDSNSSQGSGGQSSGSGSQGAPSGNAATVVWYFADDSTDYTKEVWDALNQYFIEQAGATVEYHPIAWGDYATKTSTIMSSGQAYDIMFGSNTYFKNVTAGAAKPIEDLLPEYAKETWETLPDFIWTAATVNGHIYGIPPYKDNAAVPGLIANTTMAADLGVTLPESYGNGRDIVDLLYEVKAKRDAKYPEDTRLPVLRSKLHFFDCAEEYATGASVNIPGIESYKGKGSGEVVFNIYETDEYRETQQIIRKFVEDGIMPMDISNYDPERTFRNSGKIFGEGSLGYVTIDPHAWSPDFEITVVPSTYRFLATNYILFGSNIIGANSKQPESALKVLNLVNTDNYVANTIRFGIEGKFYTKTTDNRLDFSTSEINSDPAARGYYKWYGWQFGNLFAMSLPVQESGTLWDDLKEANETAYLSDNLGFVFDQGPVTNEIAACSSASSEYTTNLDAGMTDDVNAAIDALIAKLKSSGVDKITAEAQKQLNEWREANGKTVAK